MSIRYNGNEIIHDYKGIEIQKVVKYYSQGDEIFYRVENVEDRVFLRLKDAKHYIDNNMITAYKMKSNSQR